MCEQLTYRQLVELHVEKFGVEPVTTDTENTDITCIIEAIEANEPYIEP